MKKLALLVGAIALTGSSMAQRPTDSNPFSLEGGLSLNTTSNTFNAPMLKLRYFAADNFAVRLGLQMNNSKEVENFYGFDAQGDETTDSLGTITTKDRLTWISLGGSYHFSQMERLSPYVALDVMIGMESTKVDGVDTDGNGYDAGRTSTSTTKNSGLGLNIAGGFDYYFAENVFIGGEVGFMFLSMKDKGGEASTTFGSTTTTVTTLPAGSGSSFGNSATAAIRLGWRF
jgi:outer membrane protein W